MPRSPPLIESMFVDQHEVADARLEARLFVQLAGESLSRCAAAAGVFTPVVLQMIAVGE